MAELGRDDGLAMVDWAAWERIEKEKKGKRGVGRRKNDQWTAHGKRNQVDANSVQNQFEN
jgi:hypothetical protein